MSRGELRIFIVAGEHSGDQLGAKLMAALKRQHGAPIHFAGVGAEHMSAEGLVSLYSLGDVAVMGPLAILKALPRLRRRVLSTVDAALAFEPDLLIIIDAPEFTHPIAKRVRRRRPTIPIVDYVSPSVWAWRPGRARKMRAYVDHLLALLPFEPDAHARLGGPPCTYVGHPLIEKMEQWAAIDPASLAARLRLDPAAPVLLVLPGSRASEVTRLMQPFGAAVGRLLASGVRPTVIIPAVSHVRALIEDRLAGWPLRPHIVDGEADKIAAFRLARAALAASGTVTLELAAVGTPMVVAYRVDAVAARLGFLVKTDMFALANLVLGEKSFPELMQDDCEPEGLAKALAAILSDGPIRDRQIAALARIAGKLAVPHLSPSDRAAEVTLRLVSKR